MEVLGDQGLLNLYFLDVGDYLNIQYRISSLQLEQSVRFISVHQFIEGEDRLGQHLV